MPVYYVGILRNTGRPAVELAAEKKLDSFNFLTRPKYSEFLDFTVGLCAERLEKNYRGEIKMAGMDKTGDYRFQAYDYKGGICGVVVTDANYNERVAQAILAKSLEFFAGKYSESAYTNLQPSPKGSPPPLAMPELKEYIDKYQRPEDIDPILRIQMELDETKTFMHKSIEAMLDRGEKLDSLVAKSDNLSSQSKMFYTQAKKQNSCCIVM
ncbi:unnamed protein product [Periconia digitata]|uniref:Uncharacterized protein n=1 Tax=Periconia digitata TaxID=1303443 RepID=A0A9W4XQG9_9PLEO|nr:unnamed protein product [Periconia digitata]